MQKSRALLNTALLKPVGTCFILATLLFVQACSFPGVYKINVQQGNIVTQEMLNQLKPGMTKRQVHFVLGNPVVKNVFDQASENYIYTYQRAGNETQTQNIRIFYKDGLFERYEGELLDEHPAY